MFDKKCSGEIDYEEFVCGLAVTCRGSWDEKVRTSDCSVSVLVCLFGYLSCLFCLSVCFVFLVCFSWSVSLCACCPFVCQSALMPGSLSLPLCLLACLALWLLFYVCVRLPVHPSVSLCICLRVIPSVPFILQGLKHLLADLSYRCLFFPISLSPPPPFFSAVTTAGGRVRYFLCREDLDSAQGR